MFSMNRLHIKKRAQILHMLCEGMSLRAVARIADVSRNTVDKLLRDVGAACLEYQDRVMVDLPCKRLQCDEIWSFVGAKEKNVPVARRGEFGIGDVWVWMAICADTKIVPCWHVDQRTGGDAYEFMSDLAPRLASRVQLTTDGLKAYLDAVEGNFGADIDFAQLIKIYGPGPIEEQRRYSPAECIGADIRLVTGDPEIDHISTSYIERQNLTMRMHMRRFTRLSNAFSKKVENHMHAISLHYMYYNFARIHKTLRVTPAMEAGTSDHVWEMEEIAALSN